MRPSPLRRLSADRRAAKTIYDYAVQRAFSRARGACQAAQTWPEIGCWGRLDPHHIKPRSRYPELTAVSDNILIVCRRHHDQIHNEPRRARAAGLLGG